jgi:hypothetical protein
MGGRGGHGQHHQPDCSAASFAKEPWDNLEGEALKAQIPSHGFAEP